MNAKLEQLMELIQDLPEEAYDEAIQKVQEIHETSKKAEAKREPCSMTCIYCGSTHVVRNGKRHKKQAYLCRNCGKTFVETTGSAIENSHSGEWLWKYVIRDTILGVPIDETVEHVYLCHSTVFNMRHKILVSLEKAVLDANPELCGTQEADETFVLESLKGTPIPDDYYRKPRQHGAKASERGISNEYICICTSTGENNECMATTVNRAKPSKAEIEEVFGDKVTEDTVIVCDGEQNYDVLGDICTVAHANRINKANGFHSFIKSRMKGYHGVATKYLNRYNILMAEIYTKDVSTLVDEIYNILIAQNGTYLSDADIKTHNLLTV